MTLSALAIKLFGLHPMFTVITLVCLIVLAALIVIETISLAGEKKVKIYKFLFTINLISVIAPIACLYIISILNIPQNGFSVTLFYLAWFVIPWIAAGIEFFIYRKKLKEIRFSKLLFINISSYFVASFWIISALPYLNTPRPSPKISCTSNLKQIGLSLKQYAMDYDDWLPDKSGAAGFEQLRSTGYLTKYRKYVCPSTRHPAGNGNQKLAEKIVSYIYKAGLKDPPAKNNDTSKIPVVWDKPENHENYGNVLFLDGHVKGFAGANWMEQAGIKTTEPNYSKDGKIYLNGLLYTGPITVYHTSGKKWTELNYKNGVPEEYLIEWDKEGNLIGKRKIVPQSIEYQWKHHRRHLKLETVNL